MSINDCTMRFAVITLYRMHAQLHRLHLSILFVVKFERYSIFCLFL